METTIGIIAGMLTSISMIPQLIKVIKEKDVKNISWSMITVLLVGVSLWVIYGILKLQWPIIVSNAFSVLVNLTFLIYYFIYKKKKTQD